MSDKESLVGKELIYTCPFTDKSNPCILDKVAGSYAYITTCPGELRTVTRKVSIADLSYLPKKALPLKVYLKGLTEIRQDLLY